MEVGIRIAVLLLGLLALYLLIWLHQHVAFRYFGPILEEELDDEDGDLE